MTSNRPGLALALGVALLVSLAPPPVGAAVPSPRIWRGVQQPDPTRDDAADAFAAGEAAFASADYSAAVDHFARAQELLPHPFTAYNLGLAQARAGLDLEAWHTFCGLQGETVDPDRLTEIEVQLARLSPSVARVQVHAPQGQAVRIDGAPAEAGAVLVRPPGPVRVEVGAQILEVELRGGELRHLEVRSVGGGGQAPGPNRAQTGILASTVVFGAATAGTATAAALLRRDRIGAPLTFTAAGLGTATLALAATALGLHLRHRRSRARR